MTDKMVDVGGQSRLGRPTSEADIVRHQSDVGRQHFLVEFPTFRPTSSSDVGPAG